MITCVFSIEHNKEDKEIERTNKVIDFIYLNYYLFPFLIYIPYVIYIELFILLIIYIIIKHCIITGLNCFLQRNVTPFEYFDTNRY